MYVTPHVQAGESEIHIAFDNPGQILCFPKCIEQRRRDNQATVDLTH